MDIPVKELLLSNAYEHIVPYNLWHELKGYEICDYYKYGQHIRIRKYNGKLLTPLISKNNHLSYMRNVLQSMSAYQPFYPEKFYSMWEVCREFKLDRTHYSNILVDATCAVGGESHGLSELESLIYFGNYFCSNGYDRKYYLNLDVEKSPIDYLNQIYDVNEYFSDRINGRSNDRIYDLIVMPLTLNMMINNEILYTLCLNDNGTLIIRAPMELTFDIKKSINTLITQFEDVSFYKPSVENKHDQSLYWIARGYGTGNVISKKHIRDRYNDCMVSIKSSNKDNSDAINSWYTKYALMSIRDFVPIERSDEFRSEQLPTIHNDDLYIKYHEITKINSTLSAIKNKLNYVKSVMDTKPNMGYQVNASVHNEYTDDDFITWEHFTSISDPYREVKFVLKKRYMADMVSNAWIKLYEILSAFPQLTSVEMLNSFHLCEAPGAFIASLNHYLRIHRPRIQWDWRAQTLSPTGTNVALEDYFGMIANNPDKWLFGTDFDATGDITHGFIIQYYRYHPELQRINFITSDAGTYIPPKQFNEQEVLSCQINYGQIIAILSCLAMGGNAIFKTFLPMISPMTRSLMYLLSHHFSEVHIVKPMSSRSTNSEIYVVLLDYQGISSSMLDELINLMPNINANYSLFDEYDPKFINAYAEIISRAVDNQIRSLESSYYYYYHMDQIPAPDTDAWFKLNRVR
jgi:hypothetical protein